MKTYQKILSLVAVTVTTGLLFSVAVYGDDDGEHESVFNWWKESKLDVAPVNNSTYRDECGSCHFAYQPGLLPQDSWREMMAGLDDHFGDNAELSAELNKEILDYLLANAADDSNYKRSERIMGSLREGEVPPRITDTLYFKRKHDEIPASYVLDNKELGSLSQCASCHTRAEAGSYDEDEIKIPGVGRWED